MNHLESALSSRNRWWRYIVLLLITFTGINIISGIIQTLFFLTCKIIASGTTSGLSISNVFSSRGISLYAKPILLILLPIAEGCFIFCLFLKPFHRRSYQSVINGTEHIRWKKYFESMAVYFTVSVCLYIPVIAANKNNFIFSFSIESLLPMFSFALLIPFQSAFEELIFRGYLPQCVAVISHRRVLAFLIPAVLFTLIHYPNPEVKVYGALYAMPQYLVMSLFLGIISILDDGIELAAGAHTANNLFAALILSGQASALASPAIFHSTSVKPEITDPLILLITTGLCTFVFARKYKWKISVLKDRIKKPSALHRRDTA